MIRSYLKTLVHICFRTKLGIGMSLAALLVVIIVAKATYSHHVEKQARIQAVPSDEIQPPKKFTFPSAPQPILPPAALRGTNLVIGLRATNIGTHFQASNILSLKARRNLTAPSRRELRCALTSSAISGGAPAPIRAIVTEPFYHKGILLVPKFSEVFGELSGSTDGDRLLTLPTWRLVFPSDFEISLNATPTYRYEEGADPKDALKEGGAGLWGFRFQSLSSEEAKLFAATFLSAVAQSIQSTRASVYGYVVKDSAKNAAAQGLSSVLNRYSERINSLLAEKQAAIMCPPGSPFWLSIAEPLSIPLTAVGPSPQ